MAGRPTSPVATQGPFQSRYPPSVSLNRGDRCKARRTLLCVCGLLRVDTHSVTTSDPLDEELSHRRTAAGENRIPPAMAVLVAAVFYALLPQSLLVGPRFAIPIIELALLAALIATNPRRMVRQSRWSRIAATALAGLVIVANLTALGKLIARSSPEHIRRFTAAGGDAGVDHQRHRFRSAVLGARPRRSRRSTEASPQGAATSGLAVFPGRERRRRDRSRSRLERKSGWVPRFVDYLYVSLTNSSAFSPTDTMPLTTRAKALMGLQATAALLTSLLVIARAVGSLGGGSG